MIGKNVFKVIATVSASHTIVEIGEEQLVQVGDVATFFGPDHPEIHPNYVSKITGVSVYDIFMHLSAKLPRVVI